VHQIFKIKCSSAVPAVSHQIVIAVVELFLRSDKVGFVVNESGTRADLFRILMFRLSVLIPPLAPNSSIVIRGGKWDAKCSEN
jgi:hypothetical protein